MTPNYYKWLSDPTSPLTQMQIMSAVMSGELTEAAYDQYLIDTKKIDELALAFLKTDAAQDATELQLMHALSLSIANLLHKVTQRKRQNTREAAIQVAFDTIRECLVGVERENQSQGS